MGTSPTAGGRQLAGDMTNHPLVDVGGRFMTGAEMAAAAAPLGLTAGALYFRGRIGAVGDVGADVAVALLGIFPSWVVELTWQGSAALPVAPAVDAYERACAEWGRARLAQLPGAPRLAELAYRVCDAAQPSGLALFAAWQHRARPDDHPARAAHALMVLRELRGGLHFAALRAVGLDVPLAVLGDSNGGAARLRRTAWQDDAITALEQRAIDTPDLSARWAAAETYTDDTYAAHLACLDEPERAELAQLISEAERASGRAED